MKPTPPQPPLTEEQMHKRLFCRLGALNDRWKDDGDEIDFVSVFENVMEHGPNIALRDHIEGVTDIALARDGDDRIYGRQQVDAQTAMLQERWIWRLSHTGDTIKALLEAIQKKQWRLALMLAGVMSLGDTIRAAQDGFAEKITKAATPAKPKAVQKTAKKKPAAKKPAPAKKTAPAKVATLKDLVAQAKPLFEKNPKLDRQGLINKIGRRYERLTTFDELRTLCAGKTPTAHSLKKPNILVKHEPDSQPTPAKGAPVQTQPLPAKPKRPRRDPAKPVEMLETSIPKSVRSKPWPTAGENGIYSTEQADHAADFIAGAVTCDFATIETESGWIYGTTCRIKDTKHEYRMHLFEDGPLALDADTAIRDATAEANTFVKGLLKASEPATDEARELTPHVPDLLKLRSWLLGFQVRGMEKIAFLKGQQPDLLAAA